MHSTPSVQAPGLLPLAAISVSRTAAGLRRSSPSSNLLRGRERDQAPPIADGPDGSARRTICPFF